MQWKIPYFVIWPDGEKTEESNQDYYKHHALNCEEVNNGGQIYTANGCV